MDNVRFLCAHPLQFLRVAAGTTNYLLLPWLWGLVGVFGWLTIPLPAPPVVIYLGILVTTACVRSQTSPTPSQRTLLCAFVFLTALSIQALLWVFHVEKRALQDMTGFVIPGIHGRYFLPIALPALVVISNRKLSLTPRFYAITAGLILVIHGLALQTIWHAYH